MSNLNATDDLFFTRFDLDRKQVDDTVRNALKGADDGELFLEYRQSESLAFDDGRLKNTNFDTAQGFGLRAVSGEASGFSHSATLNQASLERAATTVKAVHSGHNGTLDVSPLGRNQALYVDDNPIDLIPFQEKVKLLEQIDTYLRSKDSRVKQVSASVSASWQVVRIIRGDGSHSTDVRPLVRIGVSTVVQVGDKMETGSHGMGGRLTFENYMKPESWKPACDEALRQALVNVEAIAAPAGEMPVVLGPGWPGILLHEAIGHGLEGDFNRKKTSAFAGLLGSRIAAPGVTVVDDGTLVDRRGSLTIDDEGTATQRTVLIEDGILKGYMQDRMNARLMGVNPTGNGRRQSYAHMPLPRMTNTYMLNGDKSPEEIIASVDRGIYAVNFGGGQVDITSGKFVFSCTEAYMIEKGKIGAPVKGATLIGNGPDCLTKVKMIGNDMQLDPGIGTCGKDGQGVPVGVGQPTLLIDPITVGGTEF